MTQQEAPKVSEININNCEYTLIKYQDHKTTIMQKRNGELIKLGTVSTYACAVDICEEFARNDV